MNIDDLIFIIGKQHIEVEFLTQKNKQLEAKLVELDKSEPEKEGDTP